MNLNNLRRVQNVICKWKKEIGRLMDGSIIVIKFIKVLTRQKGGKCTN